MTNRWMRTAALSLLLALPMTLPAYGHQDETATPVVSGLQVASDEIRLRGVIQAVEEGGTRVTLIVQTVTLPDGPTTALSTARVKQVTITPVVTILRKGSETAELRDLKPGEILMVVGKNLGQGEALPARIAVLGGTAAIRYSVPVGDGVLPTPTFTPARPATPAPTRTGLDYDGVNHSRVTVPILFPIAGRVSWSDTFLASRGGGTRRHHGQDLMANKLTPLVAVFDGVVSVGEGGNAGRYLYLRGDNGWTAAYMHLNNDNPGTDDGIADRHYTYAPGIANGVRVYAGQLVGYVGDSGNAESTGAHCHFELSRQGGGVYNAAPSLANAQKLASPLPLTVAQSRSQGRGGVQVAYNPPARRSSGGLLPPLPGQSGNNAMPEPRPTPTVREDKPLSEAEVARMVAEYDQQQEDLDRREAEVKETERVAMEAEQAKNTPSDEFTVRLIDAVNGYRHAAGLSELTYNAKLQEAATTHSNNMAEKDFFRPMGTDGKMVGERVRDAKYPAGRVAENLSGGLELPEKVVARWMARSGEERRNILDPALTEIGVGYVNQPYDGGIVTLRYYWTVVFATK